MNLRSKLVNLTVWADQEQEETMLSTSCHIKKIPVVKAEEGGGGGAED